MTRFGSAPVDVTVRRWRRYGFDRLYGDSRDGRCVGWIDLDTGEHRIELAEFADAFQRAAATWHSQQLANVTRTVALVATSTVGNPPPCRSSASRRPTMSDAAGEWTDLACNAPGTLVRAKAGEARRSEPVWSLLARVAGLHTDERAWHLGAKGEELVGKELVKLGHGWHTLHSIPLGKRGGDLDHLVIGPGGVFSLNAKYHKYATVSVDSESVLVNGEPRPYIDKSRQEARRVSRILSAAMATHVPVQGVVVIVHAGELEIRRQPGDIVVIDRRRLRRWLGSRPTVHQPTVVERLGDRARRSSTWP